MQARNQIIFFHRNCGQLALKLSNHAVKNQAFQWDLQASKGQWFKCSWQPVQTLTEFHYEHFYLGLKSPWATIVVFPKTIYLPFLVSVSFRIETLNSEVKCLKPGVPACIWLIWRNGLSRDCWHLWCWHGRPAVECDKVQRVFFFYHDGPSFFFPTNNFKSHWSKKVMVILVFGVNFYFMNEIMLMSKRVSQPTSEQVSYDSGQ